jgi:hypothetical protein
MNNPMGPLWQQMGQQQPAQPTRHPYQMALERKRKRQQAKRQTQQQEAQILPMGPPQQMQPFSNFLADNMQSRQQAVGMMPMSVAMRARS